MRFSQLNHVLIYLFLETLVNSPSLSPLCDSHSPALLDLFISSDAIICSTVVFLCWEVLWSCCFCLHWLSNSKRNAFLHHTGYFHADYDSLYNNLRGEIFYGRVSLNSVLLLLLLNFLIMSRLGLMYISPIINIGSDLTHLPGFQLLGLPLKEITFFVCANKINLLTLKYSLYRLVLLAKWF